MHIVYDGQEVLLAAEQWAHEVWSGSEGAWTDSVGDTAAYRSGVLDGCLTELFGRNTLPPDGRLLDVGCGEGASTAFCLQRMTAHHGWVGRVLGIDRRGSAVGIASERFSRTRGVGIAVADASDAASFASVINPEAPFDLVVALYMLHEEPDLGAVVDNIAQVMRGGARFIVAIVHPDFAEALRTRNMLHLAPSEALRDPLSTAEGVMQWRYCASYPLVRPPAAPFYLPYVHRVQADYDAAFRRAGLDITDYFELPSRPQLELLKRNPPGRPFTEAINNVYWPTILASPSTLLFSAVKR